MVGHLRFGSVGMAVITSWSCQNPVTVYGIHACRQVILSIFTLKNNWLHPLSFQKTSPEPLSRCTHFATERTSSCHIQTRMDDGSTPERTEWPRRSPKRPACCLCWNHQRLSHQRRSLWFPTVMTSSNEQTSLESWHNITRLESMERVWLCVPASTKRLVVVPAINS